MTFAALDPLLLSCRRVFLRDYEVWINIGVHEFEKRAEQRVIINVYLYVPLDVTENPHSVAAITPCRWLTSELLGSSPTSRTPRPNTTSSPACRSLVRSNCGLKIRTNTPISSS